jgi:hypothetical protein
VKVRQASFRFSTRARTHKPGRSRNVCFLGQAEGVDRQTPLKSVENDPKATFVLWTVSARKADKPSPEQYLVSARAVPGFIRNGKEKAPALTRCEFAWHDAFGIVDEILGCSENTNDLHRFLAGDDCDSSSI